MRIRLISALLGALCLVATASPAQQRSQHAASNSSGIASEDYLYLAGDGIVDIGRVKTDGTGLEEFGFGMGSPGHLSLDPVEQKVYWFDGSKSALFRANYDGTSVEAIVGYQSGALSGIAVDVVNRKVYWSNSTTDEIKRANLDGSDIETIVNSGLDFPRGLAVEPSIDKVYWIDHGLKKIQRANLDGTGVEDVVALNPSDWEFPAVAIDANAGKLYWTQNGTAPVKRANLDGTGQEDVVIPGSTVFNPEGLALDVAGGKVYWVDQNNQKISRSNFDGSDVQDIVTSQQGVQGVAFDATNGRIFWSEATQDVLYGADSDGSNSVAIVSSDHATVNNVVMDPANNMMYWTDDWAQTVSRSNLDGSGLDRIVTTGLDRPDGIALDPFGEKIYWVDAGWSGNGAVPMQRSDLDGSNVETLVASLSATPYDIAVDPLGGMMYWTFFNTSYSIVRSQLDGSGTALIVPNPGIVRDLELDLEAGKLYWADDSNHKIQRANLDGSGVEDLVVGLDNPRGLALDMAGGKMYWIEGYDHVLRSNFDGSDRETVLASPRGTGLNDLAFFSGRAPTPISVRAPVSAMPGESFFADIWVGSDTFDVSDLFGLKLEFTYDAQNLTFITPEYDASFTSQSLNVPPTLNATDNGGVVSMVVSPSTGNEAWNGQGSIVIMRFEVPNTVQPGTEVGFTLSNVVGLRSDGTSVAMEVGDVAQMRIVGPNVTAPVVSDLALTTPEDTASDVVLQGSDADGNFLTYSVSQPTNGSASLDGDTVTYTPHPDFFGEDTFTFTASDGMFTSDPGTVTVTVNPANDPPQATAVSFSFSSVLIQGDPGDVITTATWPPSIDVDGDALSYSAQAWSSTELLDTLELGQALSLAVTAGMAAQWFDAAVGATPGSVPVGDTANIFFRIISSDQASSTTSPSAVLQLERSTVTNRETEELPTNLSIASAFPNPFSGAVTLELAVPSAQDIETRVYDVLGRLIHELPVRRFAPGEHAFVLDLSSLPQGRLIIVFEGESERSIHSVVKVDQ